MSQALIDISPDTTGTKPPKSVRHLVAYDTRTGEVLLPIISLCGRRLKADAPTTTKDPNSVRCEPCWVMFDLMNSLNS